ncbi:hypothetical protein UFOVP286_2 [uncultured Caudovirales phage]|uniref:Uncharacterized protein n=1 Tax=uncultured Caudovirales phage TaxID=2100421 RepID=A0A6J5LVE4_9CAUD|nr:hypothetical protein UFOVP286_2 [uncultured Caudovirales phage]
MKQEQKTEQRNFIESSQFLEMIDNEVKKFINNPSNHFIIEKAKKENYFGSLHSKKDLVGLLGYLRMNFGLQIRILTNCSNYFPIDTKFLEFLVIRKWFKKAVLNNNKISHNLHFKGFDTFNFNSKTINNFT